MMNIVPTRAPRITPVARPLACSKCGLMQGGFRVFCTDAELADFTITCDDCRSPWAAFRAAIRLAGQHRAAGRAAEIKAEREAAKAAAVPVVPKVRKHRDRESCQWTRKVYFPTEEIAEQELDEWRNAHPRSRYGLHTYKCPYCNGYHWTHAPAANFTKTRERNRIGAWS